MSKGELKRLVGINSLAICKIDIFSDMDKVDLDIVDIINTILPGEKHLPGMHYCGPGTRLDLKLNDDGTPKPGFEPTDQVDKIALTHDLAYSRHSDLRNRNTADKQMICELLNIEQPTCKERC